MIKPKISKRLPRILIHGTASVGKTTLASKAPSPVFICCEDGAREVDAAIWVFDEKTERVQPKTLDEFRAAVRAITTKHDGYKTLVIDGLGSLDTLVHEQLCRENPRWKGNIQTDGFGKGESATLAKWREVVTELEDANNSGLAIILLGHSRVDNFNSPDSASYGRYQLAVTSHKLGDVSGFLFGWTDVFAFARFEQMITEANKRTISIGVQGARVLHLQRTDAYDAKCRYRNAPPQIPMSWPDLERIMTASELSETDLRGQISELLPQLPEDKRSSTTTWLAGQLTVDDLAHGLDRIKATLLIKAA